ncbi:MAG: ABC transporter permease [Planctomycetaceae bacterium]|nr:ABC transporter permease [Planctomycetaceae bacterium]
MPENSSGSAHPLRATVIEARGGWQAVDFQELWRYRELLYFLVWRDVKIRYKQTVLGATWAIIQPVMTMVVFTIFFGKFGGMAEGSDFPYPILVFSALLPWTFFANSVSQGGNSLVNSAHLISKVYFPRLLIPLSTVGAPLLDLTISLGVLAVMLGGYLYAGVGNVVISPQLVLLPLFVLITILTAFGVGTLLSALTIAYRDFRYVLNFLVQLWMFASPVAYVLGGETGVPEKWWNLIALNPMTGAIVGFRRCITGQNIPWEVVGISGLSSCLFLLIGVMYFRRVEQRFADII